MLCGGHVTCSKALHLLFAAPLKVEKEEEVRLGGERGGWLRGATRKNRFLTLAVWVGAQGRSRRGMGCYSCQRGHL